MKSKLKWHFAAIEHDPRVWSYHQKFSVLNNFLKKSKELKLPFLSERPEKLSS
jgi:hypothetical protein